MSILSADQEWENFLNGDTLQDSKNEIIYGTETFIPKVTEIYISTQTKIGHLNQEIDLKSVFWGIPIISYQSPCCGVIKKQIKLSCDTKTESAQLDEKINHTDMVVINTIKFIDNPTARKIIYKDVRKINVGIAKKDLTSYRTKVKGAFYNCFVVIMRIPYNGIFKEVHIKVFNTGKLEIPGIQSDDFLFLALDALIAMLNPLCLKPLAYNNGDIDTVLINSNFTCNYYIDRDKLSSLLKYKYHLHVNYDPCSYPGIQVKFYYNSMKNIQNGVCSCEKRCSKKGSGTGENQCLEISFMVFRTGSVLIVGHCSITTLHIVYNFLKTILKGDFKEFRIETAKPLKKPEKKKKRRKKIIIMDVKSS
jgi:TATA-box binding protein (TBP) (component of TFIID and TFIIIB)